MSQFKKIYNQIDSNRSSGLDLLLVAGSTVGVLAVTFGTYTLYRRYICSPYKKYPASSLPGGAFDAIVVGSGPAGSSVAFYLAQSGVKVAVLEKEKLPRDKYCGDAVARPALKQLKEIGVLEELDSKPCNVCGIVSPNGNSYVGKRTQNVSSLGSTLTTVNRTDFDCALAKAARKAGAAVMEDRNVTEVKFDQETGLWSVKAKMSWGGPQVVVGRVLVLCDGAYSNIATKLGLCTEPPAAVRSRAYISGGTHNADFDCVNFYATDVLPGYSTVVRLSNDDLNFGHVILDGGRLKLSDIERVHTALLKSDPFISSILGKSPKVGDVVSHALRVGGQGVPTCFGQHLLIVGDAAGHCDPLTGNGVHLALKAGKLAARRIARMHKTGDYSMNSISQYQAACQSHFAYDFKASKCLASTIQSNPKLLDTLASHISRFGESALNAWCHTIHGVQPKRSLLMPHRVVPLLTSQLLDWVRAFRKNAGGGKIVVKGA